MDERWQRLKTLFLGALEQPPDTRSDWLAREAGDNELARDAAKLLAAHANAGGFLDAPASIDPADVAHDDTLDPGARIGNYLIERQIGQGGMAIVYAARDLKLNRRVALKMLPHHRDDDEQWRERLRREARAAATIAHPSVATVFDLEEIDGRLFIASELVDGFTLREAIASAPLSRTQALGIAADITRALCAAHDAGVVHRDLKPENVMITRGGSVKVLDFGIAHVEHVQTRITLPGHVVGTPAYMAPEQVLGAPGDARVDIYAVGVMLAEMLAGAHPLTVGSKRTDATTSQVAALCMKADPRERYQSARQLLEAIEREGIQGAATTGQGDAQAARWWWEFHQGMAAAVYSVMTWPAWMARSWIGGLEGNALFVAVLVGSIVAAALRLHLWFVSRFYPGELGWARGRTRRWIAAADALFTSAIILGGILVGEGRVVLAIVEIAVGIGAAVAFLLIEPATARAAFGGN